MIEPQSRDELNAILDLHLEDLDTEERLEMMLEFYYHVRTYIAEPDDDDIAALRKVVYASHLFLRIFDARYTEAESHLAAVDSLKRCFDK